MPRLKHEAETAGSAPVALPASPFASSSTLLDSGGCRRTHRQRHPAAIFTIRASEAQTLHTLAIRGNVGLTSGLFIFYLFIFV